jgi:hypothetical protein
MEIPRSLVLCSFIALWTVPASSTAKRQQTSPYPDIDQRVFSFELADPERATIETEQVSIGMTIIDSENFREHTKVWTSFELSLSVSHV